MKNSAGPGARIAAFGGICATWRVAEPSLFVVNEVSSSMWRWPMFMECVEKPVRMTTALVLLMLSVSLNKSVSDNETLK